MNIVGSLSAVAAAIGTLGATFAIAKLAAASVDGIARQPEAAPKIQVTMIVAGALIEGIALFFLVVCLIDK